MATFLIPLRFIEFDQLSALKLRRVVASFTSFSQGVTVIHLFNKLKKFQGIIAATKQYWQSYIKNSFQVHSTL